MRAIIRHHALLSYVWRVSAGFTVWIFAIVMEFTVRKESWLQHYRSFLRATNDLLFEVNSMNEFGFLGCPLFLSDFGLWVPFQKTQEKPESKLLICSGFTTFIFLFFISLKLACHVLSIFLFFTCELMNVLALTSRPYFPLFIYLCILTESYIAKFISCTNGGFYDYKDLARFAGTLPISGGFLRLQTNRCTV